MRRQHQQQVALQQSMVSSPPGHQFLSNVQSAVNFATQKPVKLLQHTGRDQNNPSEADTAISIGTHQHMARVGQRAAGGVAVRPTTAGRPGGRAAPINMDLTQGTLTVSGF